VVLIANQITLTIVVCDPKKVMKVVILILRYFFTLKFEKLLQMKQLPCIKQYVYTQYIYNFFIYIYSLILHKVNLLEYICTLYLLLSNMLSCLSYLLWKYLVHLFLCYQPQYHKT